MSDWVLIPSLVALRTEFNTVAPNRDKGSDGSIGNSLHTSSSDHTPDEDSAILRDHDADSKNEVHALDIDSSGPWPGGPAWFDSAIKGIVERERRRWLDPNDMCRLNYVIWNRKIADKDVNDFEWRDYHGTSDDHTGHAHFSNRYETPAENDTSPWGLTSEGASMAVQDVRDYFEGIGKAVRGDADATSQMRNDRNTLAAVLRFGEGLNYSEQGSANLTPNRLAAIMTTLSTLPGVTAAKVLEALGDPSADPAAIAAILRPVLGANSDAVGRALLSTQP